MLEGGHYVDEYGNEVQGVEEYYAEQAQEYYQEDAADEPNGQM